MKRLIESLESRQLLTASSLSLVEQDASVFHANTQSLQADLASYSQSAAAAIAKLAADSHKSKGTGHGDALKTLTTDEISGLHKVHNDVVSLLGVTITDTNAIIADIKQILKKSTPALQSKLTADIAKLKSRTTTLESNVTTDVQSVETMIGDDLTNLETFSALDTDATADKTKLTSGLNTVMTDLTSLSSTITKIATDAAQ